MLYHVRPAMFFLLSPLPSLPFLSASLIIQCWQFLPSSSSSDPGMLWPGLASLLVPWAWQRVLPWPHVRLQHSLWALLYILCLIRGLHILRQRLSVFIGFML